MRVRVEQGSWPHSAPIGYKKVDKRVVPDLKFAPIITEILIKFSTGTFSLAEIARYAFDKGVVTKSGRPKSTDAMKKILQNLIYAGYTKNKLSTKITRGKHKALVNEETIYKNIDLIQGSKKTVVLRGDDMFPLRGTLLCSNCGHPLTASPSRGKGGVYNYYHCNKPTCKRKITGKKASGDADIAHKDFREALQRLPSLEGISKLYRKIVVKAWNDEYGKAVENADFISSEITRYRQLRQGVVEKFALDKINEDDMNAQIKNIAQKINELSEDQVETDKYVKEKETIIDDAMSFIKTPDIFWNYANTSVRQDIQRLLFPTGLPYDFETGFGTHELINSYLLIKQIEENSDKNTDLVIPRGIEPLLPG